MPEIVLLLFLIIPQLVAGIYARSIGKSFWFWFFISFLIPIISLIILLLLESKQSKGDEKQSGYQLAEHVTKRTENKKPET